MRIRECYSLYKRRVPSGKTVYYYRAYDEKGKRFCGHSTGQGTKTAAHEYCRMLIKEKRLAPVKRGKGLTFEEFAAGWWDYETCPYLQSRKERRPISKGYATQGQYAVRNHLVPAFGKKRIDTIGENDIDAWLTGFRRGEYVAADKKTKVTYKGNTANLAFKILKIMLNYAAKQGLIKTNPCKYVEMVSTDDEKVIEILTPEEEQKLFPADWGRIWDLPQFYVLNRLAAISGMRHGELLGLRGEFVHEKHIDVRAQYTRFGYQDVKTHKPKNIPIPEKMYAELKLLIELNGEGYLFSRDGAERNIRKAVETAEKDEEKRSKRYRTWRNWAAAFRWRERAGDYDRYTEKLKQAEKRKTIEAQEELRRMVTGKMLLVVNKKLDLMDPAELTQGAVTAWVETASRAEREVEGLVGTSNGSAWRQGEISFAPEFNGV